MTVVNPSAEWSDKFGDDYTRRQTLSIEARLKMFQRIWQYWHPSGMVDAPPSSIIEFGANVGDNLRAIRKLTTAHLTGVEINPGAFQTLKKVADVAFNRSILDFESDGQWDLSMTRGLLIHITPADLQKAYATLYHTAKRYILIAEYFSPKPREIEYHGRMEMLWARDFAGELLDAYPDLRLVDYQFVYDRDPDAPQDNVTWFLMEKQ